MRRALQYLALAVILLGVGLWMAGGQNRGWTKTSIAVEQVDPVTDLRYTTDKPGFYPGVDLLALTGLLAAGLFGVSFLTSRKLKTHY